MSNPTLEHTVHTLQGNPKSLADYRGKVMLIVNTASACGLTPQYAGLQALHERYESKGLAVLGFPCNDFGAQEPGTHEEIHTFCETHYSVTFPLFSKVKALGDKSPLYRTLTEEVPEPFQGEIRWNFTKFLVSAEGKVIARFEPMTDPLAEEVTKAIEAALP